MALAWMQEGWRRRRRRRRLASGRNIVDLCLICEIDEFLTQPFTDNFAFLYDDFTQIEAGQEQWGGSVKD